MVVSQYVYDHLDMSSLIVITGISMCFRIHKMMYIFSGPEMGFVIILQYFLKIGIVYLFLKRNITGCIHQYKSESM